MRLPGRAGENRRRRSRWPVALFGFAAIVAAAALGTAMLVNGQGAARLAAAASTLSRQPPGAPPAVRSARFDTGRPAVGALFLTSAGRLERHICTASVVDSPGRDLLITAAHCVSGAAPSRLAFVPGYHDGREPYGSWHITRVFVDRAWAAGHNPDHDVAFLVARQAGSSAPIQDLTGGERLGTTPGTAVRVLVIGYPNARQRPLSCRARSRPFGPHQQVFDCAGYTDGTSGGPFLAHAGPGTGEGTVIGVIGGYERGGDTPAVSYSARFGSAVRSLYRAAVAGS